MDPTADAIELVRPRAFTGFRRVLCAVNGSRGRGTRSRRRFRIAGARPGGAALEFVAVTDAQGAGAMAQATLSEPRARAAVAEALHRAPGASGRVVHAADIPAALLEASRSADPLVVGRPPLPRAAGIIVGGVAARALHAAALPVLIARRPPDAGFPGTRVVATRGTADDAAVDVASWLAESAGAQLVLVHVGASTADVHAGLARQAAGVLERTGVEPVVLSIDGHPAQRLIDTATAIDAGLVVLGSRGLLGPHALASVSERVAHRCPCSVLVRARNTSAAMKPTTVVIGFDGSSNSRLAIESAARLYPGARTLVVTCWRSSADAARAAGTVMSRGMIAEAVAKLDGAARDHALATASEGARLAREAGSRPRPPSSVRPPRSGARSRLRRGGRSRRGRSRQARTVGPGVRGPREHLPRARAPQPGPGARGP